jgi:riboflavin kinase/FMN adenylyltransferase
MAKPALYGVFAVTLSVLNAAGRPQYKGVANIGVRPTVQGSVPILEVHLFDFDGDLYNQYVAVRFCYFIRAERKMSGLAELEQQILWDKTVAVDYFIREPMIFEDKSKNHE